MARETLEWALKYARHGWRVFPLVPDGKTPLARLAPHGVNDATTDAATIRKWFAAEPTANLGIACGVGDCGPYVVDVDAPNGGHKNDGADSLAAAGIDLPPTLTATTPNGGRHFYYGLVTPPRADQLRNCANVNGLAGVDIRTAGGYVVAPPSSIGGKAYQFENWKERGALAEFPAVLYRKERTQEAQAAESPAPPTDAPRDHPPTGRPDTRERARRYLVSCDAAISGQGGHAATIHAAHALVVGFGLDADTALGLLMSDFNPRCVPPWTEKELRHKVESARANPQRPLGYLLAADGAGVDGRTERDDLDALGAEVAERMLATQGQDAAQATPDELAARYARRRALADFPDPVPEEENPRALFKGGWLRKGGGALFVSVSGAGKSVAATQFAACFALGRPWMGIEPLRPLRIAVYQWEDDADEVADFRENIRRGLLAAGWTHEEVARALSRITYHDVTGLVGDSFLAYLVYAQGRDMADLLILNPLQSFAGCDLTKNNELSDLLRAKLDPILRNENAPCGCIIVHHTNKVPTNGRERRDWLGDNSAAYAGAGGAELVNWARPVLTLRPHENASGYYDLIAAKRGKRLGWKDADGNPTLIKPIAHTEGLMFWREVSPDELDAIGTTRQACDDAKRGEVLELCRIYGKPFASGEALVASVVAKGIAKKTLAHKLVKECVERGELNKRKCESGNRYMIGTPEQMYAGGDERQNTGEEEPDQRALMPWERRTQKHLSDLPR